jgi:hypothetical protein
MQQIGEAEPFKRGLHLRILESRIDAGVAVAVLDVPGVDLANHLSVRTDSGTTTCGENLMLRSRKGIPCW